MSIFKSLKTLIIVCLYYIFTLLIYLKVIVKPEDVLTDGLFESDIVLRSDQAEAIFSQYTNDNDENSRTKRKVIRDLASLWPSMPINYIFDGTHSKFYLEACNFNSFYSMNYLKVLLKKTQ